MNPAKASNEGQSGDKATRTPSKPELNYYKILDIRESADRMEIRESYVRLKKTFSGQNQALYSLVSPEESAKALREVEEAFRVLDDDQQREAYDKMLFGPGCRAAVQGRHQDPSARYTVEPSFGGNQAGQENGDPFHGSLAVEQNQTDIDPEAALTGFSHQLSHLSTAAISESMKGLKNATRLVSDWTPDVANHTYVPKQYPPIEKVLKRALSDEYRDQIAELIGRSDIGSGLLYKEIRELLEVSRNEIQNKTKISPEYVIAIEENAFHILPAAVYVKGFVKSYLEYLGVDNVDVIARAFIERFQKWQAAEKP